MANIFDPPVKQAEEDQQEAQTKQEANEAQEQEGKGDEVEGE
jgi:hypothetical protein